MDVIVNIESHSVFIPSVFEIMYQVKTFPDSYMIVGDKHFQSYFLKYENITDFLEKEKEFFLMTGFQENAQEQIYSNLCGIYTLLENMKNTGPEEIKRIQVYGTGSIMAGICIKKYLNKPVDLYLNFIPKDVINHSFTKNTLITQRLIKYGCEQAETVHTISPDIKQFLIRDLQVPGEKVHLYTPSFFCEETKGLKNKKLLMVNNDLLNAANSNSILEIIKKNNISIMITNHKENAVQFYRYMLYYFPDRIESFFIEDLYHYSFFTLLRNISDIFIVNHFEENSHNLYFQAYLASQGVSMKQIDLVMGSKEMISKMEVNT